MTDRARVLLFLAAAAPVLLLLRAAVHSRDHWTVLEAVDTGRDDGERLDEGSRFRFATLSTSLRGSAEVQLGRALRVSASSATVVDLPPGPGRWVNRKRLLRLESGTIDLTSGDRPLDFELTVVTTEARIRIGPSPFTLSVGRADLATNVAVLEGDVDAETVDGEYAVHPPPGMLARLRTGDIPPVVEPLPDAERARLEPFRVRGTAGPP